MSNHVEAKQLAGVLGYFDHDHALIEAMTKVKESKKFKHYDAFTPYPVHGLDAAQGLDRSPLPFVTFAAGMTGCTLGFLLQYWTSVVDWPLIVGGKPFNSWPAFVPVMFECTILFAGLATVGAMFLINGLPNHKKKIFDPKLTQDRFAILIEAPSHKEDESFNESKAAEFLKSIGAKDVKSVYAEGWF